MAEGESLEERWDLMEAFVLSRSPTLQESFPLLVVNTRIHQKAVDFRNQVTKEGRESQ
jgi:hypothetical protein